jgi:transcriptional regulator with XRE-family HTH domain
MDLPRQLADSLRRLRERAGLSQTEMARHLGISQPTLNRLENAAQNTTLKTLGALCRALRCAVGDLFEGDVKPGRSSPPSKRKGVAPAAVSNCPLLTSLLLSPENPRMVPGLGWCAWWGDVIESDP